jgi:hypothetical protein
MKISALIYHIKLSFKKFLFLLSRPYYMIRTSWPVWYFILNGEGRKSWMANKPVMTAAQNRVADELLKNGIAVTSLSELFPDRPNLLADLQKAADNLMPNAQPKKGKEFLLGLWEVFPMLDLKNPFVEISLSRPVVDIINAYMQMWSKFQLFTLNLTLPVPPDSDAVKSQRWHRDPEDKKMCKMFIYLNDVDQEAGPFIYIPESNHGGRWRYLFPQKPPKGVYPPEGAVEKVVPASDVKQYMGKAGTVVFADPSGLHKGGYAKSKKRLMFTAGFNSKATAWPVQYRVPENFQSELEKVSDPVIRYALDNPISTGGSEMM